MFRCPPNRVKTRVSGSDASQARRCRVVRRPPTFMGPAWRCGPTLPYLCHKSATLLRSLLPRAPLLLAVEHGWGLGTVWSPAVPCLGVHAGTAYVPSRDHALAALVGAAPVLNAALVKVQARVHEPVALVPRAKALESAAPHRLRSPPGESLGSSHRRRVRGSRSRSAPSPRPPRCRRSSAARALPLSRGIEACRGSSLRWSPITNGSIGHQQRGRSAVTCLWRDRKTVPTPDRSSIDRTSPSEGGVLGTLGSRLAVPPRKGASAECMQGMGAGRAPQSVEFHRKRTHSLRGSRDPSLAPPVNPECETMDRWCGGVGMMTNAAAASLPERRSPDTLQSSPD